MHTGFSVRSKRLKSEQTNIPCLSQGVEEVLHIWAISEVSEAYCGRPGRAGRASRAGIIRVPAQEAKIADVTAESYRIFVSRNPSRRGRSATAKGSGHAQRSAQIATLMRDSPTTSEAYSSSGMGAESWSGTFNQLPSHLVDFVLSSMRNGQSHGTRSGSERWTGSSGKWGPARELEASIKRHSEAWLSTGSFGRQQLGHDDDSDTRVLARFFAGTLAPNRQGRNIGQRDIRAFVTSFVSTSGPLSVDGRS
ncbi:hypothetical protein HPB47_002424 [Ixodes persulcatus]|uniref:Uncharacterized protein n=1 Tax=Ixodes persulcatus TaxID=34615 RepID=A0AC60PLM0_IXOPE|nr:hypothetical protein HPB47_002424 [Ixodes persulcatus]